MKDFRELTRTGSSSLRKYGRKPISSSSRAIASPLNCRPKNAFGLMPHLRKTAVSIPSNIAGGCGRKGDRELTRFLNIASGSAAEIDYQLLLARDLAYLPADR